MRLPAIVTLLAVCAGLPALARDPDPVNLVAPKLGRFFGPFTGCAILHDLARNETIRVNPEHCGQRVFPCSTFKIWHSLVALETGVLQDENTVIPWDGTQHKIAAWNRDQTLASAFKESAVWYYQAVAARIGRERMEDWLNKVPYGDRNMSAGLTRFWLSSLTISPNEQALFLRDLFLDRLPFREDVQATVRKIMVQESREGGATLSGKTGSGETEDGKALGWFVGHVSGKDGAPGHVFIVEIEGGRADGRAAREVALNILADRELW